MESNKLMFLLFQFSLLSSQFGKALTDSNLQDDNIDRSALLSLKTHVSSDPFGALLSWNSTTPLCHWRGLACKNHHQPKRVTTLILSNLNLTGTMSSSIANLTFLRHLDLHNNFFHGNILEDLSRLSHLEYLSLTNNFLYGAIPPMLANCSALRYLNLARAQLTGPIPATLGLLMMLQLLDLSENQLVGDIPHSMGNLTDLLELILFENNLKGKLPLEFGKLTRLKHLDSALNDLHSTLPLSIFNLSSLQIFNVGKNSFSGTLPPNIGYTLPNLQQFDVFYNQLGGQIPSSFSNISNIQYLSFHGNKFQGPIPTNIGVHGALTVFEIGNNLLEVNDPRDWGFMNSLTNCSNLQILNCDLNNFKGVLPKTIANLSTELTWLDFSSNQILGSFPSEISRFYKLTHFDVSRNFLVGKIPETIGKLQSLHWLGSSQNNLTGEIPSSLGNLSQLNILDLSLNYLEGSIPMTIGNLVNLESLNLSYNKLSGSIPSGLTELSSLSQYIDLSNNFLRGPIPSQVGSLENLGILNMAYNNLTGEIPTTIGNCLLMEKLYLQGNFFQGKIPSALSNLRGIQQLDLSNNNLSGPVPEFLTSFELLLYLNVSFNNLVGIVPSDGIFRNKSAVSLIGNNNLCGGPSWLNLAPCPHEGTNKANHGRFRYKLIIILSIIPTIIIFSLCAYFLSRRSNKKKSNNMPHELSLMKGHEWISYFELRRITNGFSSNNIIGTGSFGSVYKGILPDSREVAIKVLNLQHSSANRTFLAECEALRRIQHRNLIKLITVCSSIDHNGNEFKALVFEFMPNGSLHEQLHSEDDTRRLNLKERLDIAIGVAYALEYLHCRVEPPIAHCDLKPSNIFLDADFVVHVGDFGLARLLGNATSMTTEVQSSSTIGLRGTIGYLAPEYGMGVKGSTEGDVYSFGVLLLEIITGQRPTDEMFHGTLTLPKFVKTAHPDRVLEIVDPNLINDDERGIFCAISLSKVGLLCTKELPKDRMSMQEVLHELLLIKDSYNKMNEQARSAQ